MISLTNLRKPKHAYIGNRALPTAQLLCREDPAMFHAASKRRMSAKAFPVMALSLALSRVKSFEAYLGAVGVIWSQSG